jgi:hypothetical protein
MKEKEKENSAATAVAENENVTSAKEAENTENANAVSAENAENNPTKMPKKNKKSKSKKKWQPQGISTNMSEGPIMNFLRNFFRCSKRRMIPPEKLPEVAQQLQKAGVDVSKMTEEDGVRLLQGEKTEKIYDVKTVVGDQVFDNKAKLQCNYSKKDDSVSLYCHYKYPYLNLDKPYLGHVWTDEEKKNIVSKGTPGHQVELTFGSGNKYLCLVSVDNDLNSFVCRNINNIAISNDFCGHVFSDEEKDKLKAGQHLFIDDFVAKDGKKYSSFVQFNVAKNGLEMRMPGYEQQIKTKKNLALTKEDKKKIETGETVEKVFVGRDNLEHFAFIRKNAETKKYEFTFPSEYNSVENILNRSEAEQMKIAKYSNNAAVLELLGKSKSSNVLVIVAQNRATPHKTLDELSSSEQPAVRRAVANNEKTPGTTLTKLVSDVDNEVRKNIACNKNTSTETLKILATDYVIDDIALNALENRGENKNLVFTTSEYITIARSRNTNPVILGKIAEDKTLEQEARMCAIMNPNIPEKTVNNIASKRDNEDGNVWSAAIWEQKFLQGVKDIKNEEKKSKQKNHKRGIKM